MVLRLSLYASPDPNIPAKLKKILPYACVHWQL